MSFNDRIAASQIAINMFDAWCIQNNLIIGKSGYENWGDEIFRGRIKQLDDITAKRIRFFPDRTILGQKGAQLVEVKNSISIEKDAYDTYMDLYRTGYHVGIVFRIEDGTQYASEGFVILLYCDINSLQAKVPEDRYLIRNGICIPVIDDVWIAPRNLPDQEYYEWKKLNPRASGTTYALVDFRATPWKKLWDENENGDLGVPIR